MTRIPQASENPHEPPPVTPAQRRAARARSFDPWGDRKRQLSYAPRRTRRPSHLYLVMAIVAGAPHLIKIGIAFDVELRVAQLQSSSPVQLKLIGWVNCGGRWLENALHRMLVNRRSHGEWFDVELRDVISVIEACGFAFIEVP